MSGHTSASPLASIALGLGILSTLILVLGLVVLGQIQGEAVFGPMLATALLLGIVAVAGVAVAIIALVRRARPVWMGVVGLVGSAIALIIAALGLVGLVLVFAFLSSSSNYFY